MFQIIPSQIDAPMLLTVSPVVDPTDIQVVEHVLAGNFASSDGRGIGTTSRGALEGKATEIRVGQQLESIGLVIHPREKSDKETASHEAAHVVSLDA